MRVQCMGIEEVITASRICRWEWRVLSRHRWSYPLLERKYNFWKIGDLHHYYERLAA